MSFLISPIHYYIVHLLSQSIFCVEVRIGVHARLKRVWPPLLRTYYIHYACHTENIHGLPRFITIGWGMTEEQSVA